MSQRNPYVAGTFYPAQKAEALRQVRAFVGGAAPPLLPRPLCAAVVPHAGWAYSAATAAHAFRALQDSWPAQQPPPETVILFGAVHRWGVGRPSVYATGSWRTPLGDVAVDAELAAAVLGSDSAGVVDAPSAHEAEHSIEVLLPFLQHVLPAAKIMPIAIPPIASAKQAGAAVAECSRELSRTVVALGSSDLTHYGPRYGMAPAGVGQAALEWTHANDRRIIDIMEQLETDAVLGEAQAHHNCCGAGAIAATMGFAEACGASEGFLLHYTTSHEVMVAADGWQGQPSDMVGYAAVAFC